MSVGPVLPVLGRISEIEARFGDRRPSAAEGTGDFDAALAAADEAAASAGSTTPMDRVAAALVSEATTASVPTSLRGALAPFADLVPASPHPGVSAASPNPAASAFPTPAAAAPAYGYPAVATAPTYGSPAVAAAPAYGSPAVAAAPAYGSPAYGYPAVAAAPSYGSPAAPAYGYPAVAAAPAYGYPAAPTYGLPAAAAPGVHHAPTGAAPAFDARADVPASVPYADLFTAAGDRHGVPPRLLAAVGHVESRYQPDVVSEAGAMGLMQLMPFVAEELGVDAFDPPAAVDGAARLLAQHQERFGSWDLALAAYFSGAGAVSRAGNVPPTTRSQQYVDNVLDRMEHM